MTNSGEQPKAFRHVLARETAPPIDLVFGREVTLGRSKSCDIQITSRKASRVHARIDWHDDKALIHDLDSNNGTYVNDKRIRFHTLKDGDEIRVASFVGIYRAIHDNAELTIDSQFSALSTTNDNDSIHSGHLSKTPLLKVLTLLSRENFTGQVNLLPKLGRIGLRDGEPVWAFNEEYTGEQAILNLLLVENGMYFASSRQVDNVSDNIHQNLAQILASAIKRGTNKLQREVLAEQMSLTPPRTKTVSPPPRKSSLFRNRGQQRPVVSDIDSVRQETSPATSPDSVKPPLEPYVDEDQIATRYEPPIRVADSGQRKRPTRAPRKTARLRKLEADRAEFKDRRASSKFSKK